MVARQKKDKPAELPKSTKRTKRKFRKLCWLLFLIPIGGLLVGLLLYKPSGYITPKPADSNEVSTYLTHSVLPQFYNSLQKGQSFRMVITQKGINEMIALCKWPMKYDDLTFSMPTVLLKEEQLIIMDTLTAKGVDMVLTVWSRPRIEKGGQLNLRVERVNLGAVNITPLARSAARSIYHKASADLSEKSRDLAENVAMSILAGEPFEPVLQAEDNLVRLEKLSIDSKKLNVTLDPVEQNGEVASN